MRDLVACVGESAVEAVGGALERLGDAQPAQVAMHRAAAVEPSVLGQIGILEERLDALRELSRLFGGPTVEGVS